MKYLFETHAHTAENSPCALVGAQDVLKEYKSNGYHGIVFTDHVGKWAFSKLEGSWKDKVDKFFDNYDMAKKAGEELGIKVLCGMEVSLGKPSRDYLAYGFDREFLYKHEDVYKMNLDEFFELAKENDILLLAAHPFRYTGHTPDARYMHGVEVFNGNPRHQSNNDVAMDWAIKNNLLRLAGSDFHEYGDLSAGVLIPKMPDTIEDFDEIIRSGDYELAY